MSGLEAFRVDAGADALRSLRDGRLVGAAPDPQVGGRFLYSDADVVTFANRMQGGGPYYSFGDAGHGGSWSPNDGERALSHANAFISAPSASYWAYPTPLSTSGPEPGITSGNMTVNESIRPMRAAWCAMTMPGHANNTTWRNETKALLLWTANHSNHDFADNSKWPVNFAGFAANPIFVVAAWLHRLFKARDMLGRDAFTTQENATFDNWMYRWANWAFHWFHLTSIGNKVPNRLSRDYITGINWPGYRTSVPPPYDGGPYPSWASVYGHTNRHSSVMDSAAYVANYLKHFNVVPSTSGTQPTYGWYTVDELVLHARVYVEEAVTLSLYPLGMSGDFHRNWNDNGTFSGAGWTYAGNEIVSWIAIANYFALRGDLSLWNWSTTLGHLGTEGSPNTAAGISGFPAKNVLYAVWMHTRYVPDGWGRRTNGQRLPPVGTYYAYRDVLMSAMASHFQSNAYLTSSWRRQGNEFPAFTQYVESQGVFNARDGEIGKHMGLIEYGGV
jgi:hypothetical protein